MKKGGARQADARNRSSHACLPKRTTLSVQEGEGRRCIDRRQAEWVLELQLKASFLSYDQHNCFILPFQLKMDLQRVLQHCARHLWIALLYNTWEQKTHDHSFFPLNAAHINVGNGVNITTFSHKQMWNLAIYSIEITVIHHLLQKIESAPQTYTAVHNIIL